MKYTLVNEHSNINFHDAYINGVYCKDNNMILELVALQTQNIIKEINDNNCYIKNAIMILENVHIENIIIGGYKRYENGVLIESRESIYASPNEYDSLLKNISYKNFSEIFGIKDLPPTEERQYKISIMAVYEIIVAFKKSIIMWDEFGGVEWHRNKLWSNEHPN